ncbi:MAG TPA: hypothetical protein VK938_01820 [Methylophilaceae bacterium]|nr:hypothetical protein [Methylophilaceae bacterium]
MAKPGVKEKPTQRPESLISVLKAGAQFILMIMGIIGLAILIFSEDGWLATFVGKLTQIDSFGSLLIIPLAIIAIYVARVWFEKTFAKSSAAVIGNLAMYVMMAIGAFFLFRLLSTGSFTG